MQYVVEGKSPEGRISSLRITYIDEIIRIELVVAMTALYVIIDESVNIEIK